ncbi:hypothetical protein [Paenibacillus agricola]|uniref:MotA/TolQ/ExbB proton channel domain-containing protein n=1 Tax=Paenibacillus agricola TaxID=2716264 RepID=A0ABX0JD84_9BACL|nr:hypothetical protein [Paenibacillus agricola]NHN33214.1 hypothetical protein [Paenibacillus agricola]
MFTDQYIEQISIIIKNPFMLVIFTFAIIVVLVKLILSFMRIKVDQRTSEITLGISSIFMIGAMAIIFIKVYPPAGEQGYLNLIGFSMMFSCMAGILFCLIETIKAYLGRPSFFRRKE